MVRIPLSRAPAGGNLCHDRRGHVRVPQERSNCAAAGEDGAAEAQHTRARHIRGWPHFQLLLEIHAFTLSDERFHIKPAEISSLLQIFFFEINAIFPIVLESEFWSNYDSGIEPTITVFAMVLLVLRDKLAEEVSRAVYSRKRTEAQSDELYDGLEQFMDGLDFKIRQLNMIVKQLCDHSKVNQLVVMLLLSLHHWFSSSGSEPCSLDLICGINLAFALVIHKILTRKFISQPRTARLSKLWWTCYVLDRFNLVTNFRCFSIKHEDFNLELLHENLNLLQMMQLFKSFEKMLV